MTGKQMGTNLVAIFFTTEIFHLSDAALPGNGRNDLVAWLLAWLSGLLYVLLIIGSTTARNCTVLGRELCNKFISLQGRRGTDYTD